MQKIVSLFRVATRALRRNVLRTLLTMLGIIIGVAAVIAMVSIGTGARVQMEKAVAGLGQNVIIVMAGSTMRGGVFMGMGAAPTLTLEDVAVLRTEVENIAYLSPEARGAAQI